MVRDDGGGVGSLGGAEHLKAPGKPEEFVDPLKWLNEVSDFISPSWWLSEILSATIDVNPLEYVTKDLAGDWESYARCAAAWESLGKCLGVMAEDLRQGLVPLEQGWRGNAADGAHVYFRDLAEAIDDKKASLDKLHDEYLQTSRGVWEFAKAAKDMLKDVLDKLIFAAVSAMAGLALSWTGGLAAVAWSLAALEMKAVIDAWKIVTRLVENTQKMVLAARGVILQVTGTSGDLTRIPLPNSSYDHPAVR